MQDIQPRLFNHVRCKGVAARAGSVHFMYSNDRKGGARTHPSTTGSPSTNITGQHEPLHHTPNTMVPPTSWVGGTTTPPHNNQPADRLPVSSSSLTDRLGLGLEGGQRWPVAGAHPPPAYATSIARACEQTTASGSFAKATPKSMTSQTHVHPYDSNWLFFKVKNSVKPLILVWCGQLPHFSSRQLPVTNFTCIMLPGSSWPYPVRIIFHISSAKSSIAFRDFCLSVSGVTHLRSRFQGGH